MIASEAENRRNLQLKVDLQSQLDLSDDTKRALKKQIDILTALQPAPPNAASTSSGSTRPAGLNDRVTGLLGQLQNLLQTDFQTDAKYDYDNMIERIHKLIENAFQDVDRDRAVKDLVVRLEIGMHRDIRESIIFTLVRELHEELAAIIKQKEDDPMGYAQVLIDNGHSTHREMTTDSTEVRRDKSASTPAGAERPRAGDLSQMIKDLSETRTSPRAAVEAGSRAPPSSTVTPGSGETLGGDAPAAAASAPVNAAEADKPEDKAKSAAETDKAKGKSTNRSYFSMPAVFSGTKTKPVAPPNTKPGAAGGGP
jgi:hypothetical protein